MANKTVNKVTLIRRMGADPVMDRTQGGNSFVTISLATNEVRKFGELRREHTDWHRVTFWRKQAELILRLGKKSALVYVEGRIHYKKEDTGNGARGWVTEIEVYEFQVLSGGDQEAGGEPPVMHSGGLTDDEGNLISPGQIPRRLRRGVSS